MGGPDGQSGETLAALTEATLLRRRGDLKGAQERCAAILADHPEHPDALHLLAAIDLERDALDDAERLARRALTAAGSPSPLILTTLGRILVGRGAMDQAGSCFHQALATDPDLAIAHEGLGIFLKAQGHPEQAAECLRRAVDLTPERAEAHDELGRVLNNLRRLDEAEACFRRVVELRPAFAPGHDRLGHVLRGQGRMAEAEAAFREAVRLDPRLARAWINLGTTLMAREDPAGAADAFGQAVALDPDDADARFDLALAYERCGRPARALDQLREARRLAPGDPDVAVNLAGLLQDQGEAMAAIRVLRETLDRHPDHAQAVVGIATNLDIMGEYAEGLAWVDRHPRLLEAEPDLRIIRAQLLHHLDRGPEAVPDLEDLLRTPGLPADQRAITLFTLGEILDRAADHGAAWRAFETGNALRRGGFDRAACADLVERIIKRFDRETLRALDGAGREDRRPIFIVGMPRSGTSLVEQILASHPEVHAAGELAEFGILAHGLMAAEDGGEISTLRRRVRRVADDYSEVLDGLIAPEAGRVTDKMWQNFEWLGLIQAALPGARIVQCVRDPLDVSLSCFFQSFGRFGIPFSYDLDDIILAFEHYHRLMEHWRAVLDLPIHRVIYEDLVREPEAVIRALLASLDLSWDPACLRFHENRRVATTASNAQIRQPIHGGRMGRWRPYSEWLPRNLMGLPERLGPEAGSQPSNADARGPSQGS